MNNISGTDVTLLTLALADFAAIPSLLSNHDLITAAAFFVVGVVLVCLYHAFGSKTV